MDLTIEVVWTCDTNVNWACEVLGSHGKKYVVRFGLLEPWLQSERCVQYDWTCTCEHFQRRVARNADAYCKHIEQTKAQRCGWNGELDPGIRPLKSGECPECHGPLAAIKVAV